VCDEDAPGFRCDRLLGERLTAVRVGRGSSGADDHATRDQVGGLPECDDETELIAGEQISIGPGLFGPDRSLEIVLHPGPFFDLPKADQSLLELFREFPLVSCERREEDGPESDRNNVGPDVDFD
jgi:hypothetical protein